MKIKADINIRKEFPHLVACEHVFDIKPFPLSEALVNGSVLWPAAKQLGLLLSLYVPKLSVCFISTCLYSCCSCNWSPSSVQVENHLPDLWDPLLSSTLLHHLSWCLHLENKDVTLLTWSQYPVLKILRIWKSHTDIGDWLFLSLYIWSILVLLPLMCIRLVGTVKC